MPSHDVKFALAALAILGAIVLALSAVDSKYGFRPERFENIAPEGQASGTWKSWAAGGSRVPVSGACAGSCWDAFTNVQVSVAAFPQVSSGLQYELRAHVRGEPIFLVASKSASLGANISRDLREADALEIVLAREDQAGGEAVALHRWSLTPTTQPYAATKNMDARVSRLGGIGNLTLSVEIEVDGLAYRFGGDRPMERPGFAYCPWLERQTEPGRYQHINCFGGGEETLYRDVVGARAQDFVSMLITIENASTLHTTHQAATAPSGLAFNSISWG